MFSLRLSGLGAVLMNFCVFRLIANNVKIKPRKNFPPYGTTTCTCKHTYWNVEHVTSLSIWMYDSESHNTFVVCTCDFYLLCFYCVRFSCYCPQLVQLPVMAIMFSTHPSGDQFMMPILGPTMEGEIFVCLL